MPGRTRSTRCIAGWPRRGSRPNGSRRRSIITTSSSRPSTTRVARVASSSWRARGAERRALVTELRWDVPSAARLAQLVAAPLPLGLSAGPSWRTFHRDLYFDTPTGDLRRRDITCRMRFDVDDHRTLALDVGGIRYVAPTVEIEPRDAFHGDADPARRLRALVDPGRLVLACELEVERDLRGARLPIVPLPQFSIAYDTVTVRGTDPPPVFCELALTRRPWSVIPVGRFARALERRYGIARASLDLVERARTVRLALDTAARPPPPARHAARPRGGRARG